MILSISLCELRLVKVVVLEMTKNEGLTMWTMTRRKSLYGVEGESSLCEPYILEADIDEAQRAHL